MIIMQLKLSLSVSDVLRDLGAAAPDGPNAVYLGVPAFRYRDEELFDVAIQFCRLRPAERDYAARFQPPGNLRAYLVASQELRRSRD